MPAEYVQYSAVQKQKAGNARFFYVITGLFLKQRLDVKPLMRDDFTQPAQRLNLNLPHPFAGQANFAADIF